MRHPIFHPCLCHRHLAHLRLHCGALAGLLTHPLPASLSLAQTVALQTCAAPFCPYQWKGRSRLAAWNCILSLGRCRRVGQPCSIPIALRHLASSAHALDLLAVPLVSAARRGAAGRSRPPRHTAFSSSAYRAAASLGEAAQSEWSTANVCGGGGRIGDAAAKVGLTMRGPLPKGRCILPADP